MAGAGRDPPAEAVSGSGSTDLRLESGGRTEGGTGDPPGSFARSDWDDAGGGREGAQWPWEGEWWLRDRVEGDQGWNREWQDNDNGWVDEDADDDGFPLIAVLLILAAGIGIGLVLGRAAPR